MKNKIFKHSLLSYSALFISCIFISLTLLSSQVFAAKKDDWSNSVVQKALLSGLRWCYSSGAINFDAGKISQFNNFNQLITGGNRQDYVALPSGLTSINRDSVDCKSLFKGSGSFKGVFELAGKPEYKGNIEGLTQKITFLEGMGYSRSNEEASKKCVYYIYAERDGGGRKRTTRQVCFKGGALTLESVSDDDYPPYFYLGSGIDDNVSSGRDLTIDYQGTTKYVSYTDSEGWDTFVGKLNKIMSTHFNYIGNLWFQGDDGSGQNDYGDAEFEMDLSGSGETADKPIKFLSQYQNYYSLSFSDKERLSYYIDTIKNVFYKGASTSKYLKCDISDPTLYGSYLMINVNIETMHKNSSCGIDTSVTSDTKRVYGFVWNRGKPYFDASGATKLTLSEVVAEINKLANILTEEEVSSLASSADDESGATEPTCLSEAGTSLGWILCPVLDLLDDATKWAYEELVEPALEIEPQLFTGKGDNTRDAWRTFRDIANVFFIILFLVVIFSQLTGVGIDNYGIKKILPKLVVAAVLINLSYIICVIFVDLSNILGNSLRDIFTGLGSQLTIPGSIEGVKVNVGSGILTAIAVLVALIGGVAVAITASGGLVAFLVSLLAVALSAIIALFFLFLLLAAREAAIVVLTVLSPLAFACYILPNTQNIFKKWYQLGWRLLMVYPIAGLLIGGGDYVSKLLLSAGAGSEGFFSAFVAMIAGIVPIFFIPTVLKQSFALMGGLGAKIAGLGKSVGSKVSGDVDKSIRGSERFKNYQADRERNRKLRYARRTNRNLSDRLDTGETLSQRQRDRLARARMVESAEYDNELKRNAIIDGNRYETMRAGIEAKSRDEAINDRLALMQKNGVNGGAYNLENMKARMQNLEESSRNRALTDDEKGEMAALARGMTSKQGGASMLSGVIRQSGSNGKSNSNFMSAMGEIYSNDSTVANKMAEKDAAASAYTEKFLPNSAGYGSDFTAYKGTEDYGGDLKKRIKSYSAGLNQGGAAVTDYVNSLSKSDLQAIMNDETLRNSLDTDVREAVERRAGDLNVQRAARQVEIAGENQVFDVHSLDSDTLLDIATNPKISDNNPNRAAAVEELNKRGIK